MPRAGLSTARVVAEAAALSDEIGYDKLTLTLLAERLGVAVPSLYKHIDGLEALRVAVDLILSKRNDDTGGKVVKPEPAIS